MQAYVVYDNKANPNFTVLEVEVQDYTGGSGGFLTGAMFALFCPLLYGLTSGPHQVAPPWLDCMRCAAALAHVAVEWHFDRASERLVCGNAQ